MKVVRRRPTLGVSPVTGPSPVACGVIPGAQDFSLKVVGDSEVLGPDLSRWLITVSYERPLQAVIQCA